MRVLCVSLFSDRPEAEMFIGLKELGVDIEVMCSPESLFYQKFINSGIPVIDLELTSRIDLRAIRKIRSQLKKKDYNILHGFNNRAISNGILAATGLPIKIVAYRGIVGNVSFFNPGSWMTYLHPKVDRVSCVADSIRKHFLEMKFLWMCLPAKKFITIYKGHNLDWYKETPADLMEFGIPENAFVVGCVANFRPRKGIYVLIDAAKYLPQDKSIHILLVGNMNSIKLKKQIDNSQFKDNIHLVGFRSNAPAIIGSCNVCVLPSLKREGLPKVVIEAMSYAVPPIVTDSGGSPELIVDKKSGFIVPSGSAKAIAEAITYLYSYPEEREQIGKNAQERIRSQFRIEDTIEKTFNLYQQLLSS